MFVSLDEAVRALRGSVVRVLSVDLTTGERAVQTDGAVGHLIGARARVRVPRAHDPAAGHDARRKLRLEAEGNCALLMGVGERALARARGRGAGAAGAAGAGAALAPFFVAGGTAVVGVEVAGALLPVYGRAVCGDLADALDGQGVSAQLRRLVDAAAAVLVALNDRALLELGARHGAVDERNVLCLSAHGRLAQRPLFALGGYGAATFGRPGAAAAAHDLADVGRMLQRRLRMPPLPLPLPLPPRPTDDAADAADAEDAAPVASILAEFADRLESGSYSSAKQALGGCHRVQRAVEYNDAMRRIRARRADAEAAAAAASRSRTTFAKTAAPSRAAAAAAPTARAATARAATARAAPSRAATAREATGRAAPSRAPTALAAPSRAPAAREATGRATPGRAPTALASPSRAATARAAAPVLFDTELIGGTRAVRGPLGVVEMPNAFFCPASGALMALPVIAPSGRTYEYGSLGCDGRGGGCRDPADGGAVPAAHLRVNVALMHAINAFRYESPCDDPRALVPSVFLCPRTHRAMRWPMAILGGRPGSPAVTVEHAALRGAAEARRAVPNLALKAALDVFAECRARARAPNAPSARARAQAQARAATPACSCDPSRPESEEPLLDPILQELADDAVITAYGQTYSARGLDGWLRTGSVNDPIVRRPLDARLPHRPNEAVRRAVAWHQAGRCDPRAATWQLCPITGQTMRDPVVLEDGRSCELRALRALRAQRDVVLASEWLAARDRGAALVPAAGVVFRNYALANAIRAYCAAPAAREAAARLERPRSERAASLVAPG
jgi:hypothetical protein